MSQTPSIRELGIIEEAFSAADPFSYSPVFFHDARHDFSARMRSLFWRTWDEREDWAWTVSGREIQRRIGMCEHGYRYYRIGGYDILDGRDPEFQRFVALFSKGVLHVSDVVRVASQRAVSKGMFRATGEHPAPESLGRLAEESLCLMLLFWSADHFFRHDAYLGEPLTYNVAVSADGPEYALFDLESVAELSGCGGRMMLDACFLGLSPENPVFREEGDDPWWALIDENSVEFIRDHFHEDSPGFAQLLEAMRESYAGEEGERFFRAIVREAFVDTPVDDMTVRQAYQRMITTLDDLIGRAREKTLLSSFFALMPPTH